MFLGVFTSYQDAYDFFDARYSQALFDTQADDYYFGIRTSDTLDSADPLGGIHMISAFTAASVRVDNSSLHWVGPFWTENLFANWFDNNADYIADGLVAAGYTFGGGGSGFTFSDTITWRWDANTTVEEYDHGLSRTPDGVMADLIAVVDNNGWVVGDVIPNIHVPWRVTLAMNATKIIIQPSSSSSTFGIADHDGSRASRNFPQDSWAWRIRAYTIDALDPPADADLVLVS